MTAPSQYYKVTARVGVPHRNAVEVTIPLVGPQGPAGPQGAQGPPGEVSGTLAWDNVTGKPSTFPPSSHTHVAANITDFAAAVAAVSPPVDWNSLTGKPATFAPSAHTHTISEVTSLQTALDGKAATSHTHAANQVTDFNTAAAAAAPVQSVAGRTGAVTLAVADVSNAVATSDSRLSDSRTPTAHKNSHASSGSDPLAPSDIGAITQWSVFEETISASPTTLATGRARRITISTTQSTDTEVLLPTTGNQDADLFQLIRSGNIANGRILVKTVAGGSTLADLGTKDNAGRSLTFRWQTGGSFWAVVPVDAHAADKITSGTLDIARIPTGTSSTQVSLGNHSHGNLTSDGKLGTTAGLPLVTTTAGAVTTLALGTANQILRVNSGASGVEFADPAASGVTGAASSASDVLGVSGANITGVDANADRIVFWDDSASALKYLEAGSGLSISGTTLTATGGGVTTGSVDNAVLRADGTGGSTSQSSRILVNDEVVPFSCTAAASTDIVTAVGHNFTTNQGVRFLSLTGGGGLNTTTNYFVRDISGDTFKVSTSSGGSAVNITTDITAGSIVAIERHVAIVNNATEANSSLVLLTKGNGSFIVSNTIPDGANGGGYRGTNTIDIRAGSAASATFVASGESSVLVGASRASGSSSVSIGSAADATQPSAIAIGNSADATGDSSVAIGRDCGGLSLAANAVIIAPNQVSPLINQRGSFTTRTFGSVRWSGTTTNNTATELFLDGSSPNRCVIPASSSFIFDILISASGNSKYLMARRFLGIRRDGSNNTALVGTVQTIGTDQSEGSPTWTFSFTADDTNESLKCEVTGATSETVTWTICAFLR